MRAGMAAWVRRQLETDHREADTPVSRWDARALPATLSGDVVAVLAGMALAASAAEMQT
jgi:hypothetical protein